MRAKYGIEDADVYNFDETGFMMGVILPSMVVTRADRRGRTKESSLVIENGLRLSRESMRMGGASRHLSYFKELTIW